MYAIGVLCYVASVYTWVYGEGDICVNQVPIKVLNVLFDTGKLQRSYISKTLINANTGQWQNALRKFACLLLADQTTKQNTYKVSTSTIRFIDDDGCEVKAVVEAIVWVGDAKDGLHHTVAGCASQLTLRICCNIERC